MKVVVIGTGFVAQAYLRCLHYLGYHPLVLSRSWINYDNIRNSDELTFCLKNYRPDIVINCSGYTGKTTVDDCESNYHEARVANSTVPHRILDATKAAGAKLIHISTGCMFNGEGKFTETDKPNFLDTIYAKTKRDGERWISFYNEAWIFRIRMPFSHISHPRNWLTKIAAYDLILDGLNSITFIDEFAMRSFQLAQKAEPGIYHAACSSPIRTAQVARMLFDAGIRKKPVEMIHEADFLARGHVRRSAAVLDVSKFEKAYGAPFGDPLVSLRWCIDNLRSAHATSAA